MANPDTLDKTIQRTERNSCRHKTFATADVIAAIASAGAEKFIKWSTA